MHKLRSGNLRRGAKLEVVVDGLLIQESTEPTASPLSRKFYCLSLKTHLNLISLVFFDRFCPRFGDSTSGIEDTMGAGRKTQTFYAGESDTWPPLSGNGSILTRNLEKGELGGVIFGCKDNTMQECLSKQLFGLPHGHFSYVRNIEEGLPLFLFNYSDKKLHGIYEAASHGRLSFDAYAWTDGGTEKTHFPAQVYVRIKTQCQPLTESQFKRIIADNYFSPKHFWFELDHAQTRGLTALFKPSRPGVIMMSPAVPCRKEVFPALSANKCAQGRNRLLTVSPASKWKATDSERHLTTEASKPIWDLEPSANIVNESKSGSVQYNGGDVRQHSPNKTSCAGFEETDSKDTISDWEELAEDNAHNLSSGVRLDGANLTSQEQQSSAEGLEKEEERVFLLLQKLVAERENLKPSSNAGSSREFKHNRENAEDVCIPISSNVNYVNADNVEMMVTSGVDHGNDELVRVIEELKERTSNLEKQRAEQDHEMELLRNTFKDAGNKIQLLQDRLEELESKSSLVVDKSPDKFIEQYFGSEDVIYLIGGFNGRSWLSALDCFSPAFNIITPLKPMSCARSYASAVVLDGFLYVFGGGDGDLWFNSVECYDHWHDEWTSCPCMLREKGSLAGATLNGKIFAIGGGNGVEGFSDVEMFDPMQGTWINCPSLISARFAPAAAELNGVIYASGGYNGNVYLRSVERFDTREGTWTEVASMNFRRGCQSVAVFNEKIYCMGGYEGEKMVSSVEIFDPRLNIWEMGEPMISERGYAASAVLCNAIVTLGGIKNDKLLTDTVECYRERSGWTATGWNCIGERCFCSAVAL